MSYVDQNLISGETVMYWGKLHWIVMLRALLIFVLVGLPGAGLIYYGLTSGNSAVIAWVGLGLFVLGTVPWIRAALNRRAAEFAVTNKRVILKTGIVHRRTAEMFLQKVESIGVDQGLAGRIFGYGTIVVHGTGGTLEPFHGVSHPLEFRRQVQEQIGRQS